MDQSAGKRRKEDKHRKLLVYLVLAQYPSAEVTLGLAERSLDKDVQRYVLSLEQMVENDYPIPSYMADIFQKPPGWIETPEPPKEPFFTEGECKPKVYAIDCEMVRIWFQ